MLPAIRKAEKPASGSSPSAPEVSPERRTLSRDLHNIAKVKNLLPRKSR